MRLWPVLTMLLLAFPASAAAQSSGPAAPSSPAPPAPAAPRTPVYGYEVVRTFPHDPTAFTQGLVYRDGLLIESTGRAPSSIRRVRLEDGVVLQKRELDPEYFGEGLTEIGGRVITLTWNNRVGFVWDADDLSQTGRFTYEGEGWGLTHDGTRLILSDGSPNLRFLDPDTFAETGRVAVTLNGRLLPQLNELEWIDGEVWANVWQTRFIVRIDPASGQVVGVIDLGGLLPADQVKDPNDDVLNGIAWDAANRRLFVTGKNWPSLFEIKLTGPR
ncbi:glutaminyl-peptide cyclotransferase [uncultured Brevundimonas sp.]|uniref:glutaminyl-peptide cyclotransferase n=1 Tax=uncultured Brevundimonas sp. TaxID=213418 RepID=UPI0026182A24|nr:glutaminyl-peptide cyclotransferase [uncultured Brevundimonas sp.]